MTQGINRIEQQELKNRVVSAEEAATWIEDGMTLGLSGFTRAGDAKALPQALVKRSQTEKFKVDIFTGASLGSDLDKMMAEAGIIRKRLPFQADNVMRKRINQGEFDFVDQHLSHTAEMLRNHTMEQIDVAVVEAIKITEDGMIIPTTSVGNSLSFVESASEVIVEINTAQPEALEGVHDLFSLAKQGERQPIPLTKTGDRIGTRGIPVDPDKIKGIILTNQADSPSPIVPPDDETKQMASHLIRFLESEVEQGRLTKELAPLQSGIGSVANAVFHGLLESDFENLKVYSEVLQDAVFDLIDAGKVNMASCCSITLSEDKMNQVFNDIDQYKDQLILRTQEISNHPEIIRRLGLISINTALEMDIYGNVNSTHVLGRNMMNGIGGSGDFARNARLSIFVTKSIAKNGDISSVVPMVSHVDHTEHDVDILVTEQGYADLRGLAPRQRVEKIIQNCAHPMYRETLMNYFEEAKERGGQTPHMLEKALSWHTQFEREGTMRPLAEVKS
ncbi:acetyl-CoA hydrolase/transferase family protein [Alkalibacillus sp. S2W]|uniref:acetyl-CoA hydrolase/transferase family protein n=1 Tax=Alkalibacillus sp. S2W TaxID=3386553 RepID=UPI00398CACCA